MRANMLYVAGGLSISRERGKSLTTAKMEMKAMKTVIPEEIPLVLLGQSSPRRSQGIVPTCTNVHP